MQENVIKHYDQKYADQADSSIRRIEVQQHPKHRSEAAVYWGGAGGAFLEVGAGDGRVLLTLSDRYQECVGIELSRFRAGELQKVFKNIVNVRVVQGDFESMSLDYPQEHFDTIMMVAVIEHLIDPFAVVQKACGLLKPGGKLILDTPNIAKWTRRLKLLFGRFPSTASTDEGFLCYDKTTPANMLDEGHFHYFTYRSLKKMLLRFGFRSVEFYGYGRNPLARLFPKMFSDDCFVIGTK